MNKLFKIILIFFIVFACYFNIFESKATNNSSSEEKLWSPSTEITNASNQYGLSADTNIVSPTQKVMSTIINVIRVVGTGIALIMLTYVGIKYMSAAPSEKADFKKSATAYVVGAIILFGATNVLTIIANFATSF